MKFFLHCFFLLITHVTFAQLQNIPLVTVEGKATLKVKPDYVVLGFKVYREIRLNATGEPTGFEIFKSEDTKIKLFDFEDKDIAESCIRVENAVYVKEVFITINDLSRMDKILLDLYRLGYKKYHYFDYRVKDLTSIKYQAKVKAINSARVKAALLAKELGQAIGKAHLIEEVAYQTNNWYTLNKGEELENSTYKQDADDYLIEPGYIVITAKIKVSFDLLK
jgi:uncharacterized protein YggE